MRDIIKTLPPAPDFDLRPETFDAEAKALTQAIVPMVPEINTAIQFVNGSEERVREIVADSPTVGALAVQLAADDGADRVGFSQEAMGAVGRTVLDELRDVVKVPQFPGISAALQEANGRLSTEVQFLGGMYSLTSPIDINPYTTAIKGEGAVLDFSASPFAGPMLRIRGTSPTVSFRNGTRSCEGVSVIGPAGSTVMQVATDATGATQPQSAFYNLRDVFLSGKDGAAVDTAIKFGNHSYVNGFDNVSTAYATTHIYVPPPVGGANNYGENLRFVGGASFGYGTGYRSEWRATDANFFGRSFDQLDRFVHLINGGQAHLENCHLESPQDTQTLFELTGQSSLLTVRGGVIRTDVRTVALANVDASCANTGLVLRDVTLDMPGYAPTRLVTGAGRVAISGITWGDPAGSPPCIYSDYLNVLSDGGFLNGTFGEWVQGPGLAPTVSTGVKHNGNNSVYFNAANSSVVSLLDLTRPVRQGQQVMLEMYYKLTNLKSAVNPADYQSFSVRLDIFGKNNNNIYNQEFYFGSVAGVTVPFTRLFTPLVSRVPKGADYIRVRMGVQGCTGEAWVSSVCLNMIDS